MKFSNKRIQIAMLMICVGFFSAIFVSSCSSTSKISASKAGAQLWGENCIRCHNIPSPETFSDNEWDVAITHMRVRANLTEEEAQRIIEFLKTAN